MNNVNFAFVYLLMFWLLFFWLCVLNIHQVTLSPSCTFSCLFLFLGIMARSFNLIFLLQVHILFHSLSGSIFFSSFSLQFFSYFLWGSYCSGDPGSRRSYNHVNPSCSSHYYLYSGFCACYLISTWGFWLLKSVILKAIFILEITFNFFYHLFHLSIFSLVFLVSFFLLWIILLCSFVSSGMILLLLILFFCFFSLCTCSQINT